MGCDIHIYVERKCGGKWYNCDYFVPKANERYIGSDYIRIPIYDGRSYPLFATLANVRNYGNTDCICEPKGLPDDVTEYVADQIYDDDHNASYLTLQELIDFQKEKHPLKHRGMISPEAQKELDEYGILPDSWCQGTNQSGWEFREWEEDYDILEPLIRDLKRRANEVGMIYDFYWDSSNEKTRIEAYEKAADVRIVFWFDN